jgi:hypothetical protein
MRQYDIHPDCRRALHRTSGVQIASTAAWPSASTIQRLHAMTSMARAGDAPADP